MPGYLNSSDFWRGLPVTTYTEIGWLVSEMKHEQNYKTFPLCIHLMHFMQWPDKSRIKQLFYICYQPTSCNFPLPSSASGFSDPRTQKNKRTNSIYSQHTRLIIDCKDTHTHTQFSHRIYCILSRSQDCPVFILTILNTFAAIYLNTQGLNNSCLKSPASTLVDLTFLSRALRSFSLNQLRNLSL